ncbi:hypothetical protein AAV99_03735 [Aurantiacibacter marinus]|uniref:Uncharacterized protein n=1 Tax=Aurantiacibacter marinus TaxID=874156 RepID=A0A0H0XWH7_9SPHN|nr:hypothetical protein AAV99_03735 [Aurantiacibacter marinus]
MRPMPCAVREKFSRSMMERSANNAGSSHNSGTTAMPQRSPSKAIVSANGKSTSRDQCIEKPSGGFIRYWVTSHQLCPASRSRTCSRRIQSSAEDGSHPSSGCIARRNAQYAAHTSKTADAERNNAPCVFPDLAIGRGL